MRLSGWAASWSANAEADYWVFDQPPCDDLNGPSTPFDICHGNPPERPTPDGGENLGTSEGFNVALTL